MQAGPLQVSRLSQGPRAGWRSSEGQWAAPPSWAALGRDRLPVLAEVGNPGAHVGQTGTRLGSPFTWRSPSASSDPLWLGVSGLGLSVGAPTSAPSASQRPLRGAQVPLQRPPWAGFVTFLRLVPSPGNWDKVTALQGRPKDQVSGGGSPQPSPDGVGRRARSHRQLRLSKLLGLTCLLHWKVKTEDVPGVVTARRDSEGFLRVAEVASSFYEKEP